MPRNLTILQSLLLRTDEVIHSIGRRQQIRLLARGYQRSVIFEDGSNDRPGLAALRGSLADGKSISQAREIIASALNAAQDDTSDSDARKRTLQREIRNLTDAIAQLGLSDALRERLVHAEAELKALQRRPAADNLPSVDDVLDIYRAMLLRISEALAEDVQRARGALAQVLRTVTVRDTGEGVWAEMETRPVLAAGGALTLGLVAGDRLGTYSTARIVLL